MAEGATPLRVGVILPFSNASAGTRALANAMLKAAELALYDGANRDMVLMTADDSAKPQEAAAAAEKLLDQGARSSSARSSQRRSARWRRSRATAACRSSPSRPTGRSRATASIC